VEHASNTNVEKEGRSDVIVAALAILFVIGDFILGIAITVSIWRQLADWWFPFRALAALTVGSLATSAAYFVLAGGMVGVERVLRRLFTSTSTQRSRWRWVAKVMSLPSFLFALASAFPLRQLTFTDGEGVEPLAVIALAVAGIGYWSYLGMVTLLTSRAFVGPARNRLFSMSSAALALAFVADAYIGSLEGSLIAAALWSIVRTVLMAGVPTAVLAAIFRLTEPQRSASAVALDGTPFG